MKNTIISFEQALASLTRFKAPLYRAVEYYLSEAIAVLAVKRVYGEYFPDRAAERFDMFSLRLSEREGWPQFLCSTLTGALQDLFPVHESWLEELIFNEEALEWLIPVLDCGLYTCDDDITNILEYDEGNPLQSLPMFLAMLNGQLDEGEVRIAVERYGWPAQGYQLPNFMDYFCNGDELKRKLVEAGLPEFCDVFDVWCEDTGLIFFDAGTEFEAGDPEPVDFTEENIRQLARDWRERGAGIMENLAKAAQLAVADPQVLLCFFNYVLSCMKDRNHEEQRGEA